MMHINCHPVATFRTRGRMSFPNIFSKRLFTIRKNTHLSLALYNNINMLIKNSPQYFVLDETFCNFLRYILNSKPIEGHFDINLKEFI